MFSRKYIFNRDLMQVAYIAWLLKIGRKGQSGVRIGKEEKLRQWCINGVTAELHDASGLS